MVNCIQNYMNNILDNISNYCGIYKIINTTNGKIYIGSSLNCKIRLKTHLRELINNKHVNTKLQNSWNKYGESNFNFEVIEVVKSSLDLLVREQYYIDSLKPFFNICKIAGNTLGVKPSIKTKEKISKTLTDKYSGDKSFNYKGGYIKPKNKFELNINNLIKNDDKEPKTKQEITSGKTVLQFDSNLVLINKWSSIKKASDILKVSRCAIKRCCDGKDRHAGGFIWRLEDNQNIQHNFRLKSILQLSENNEVIGEYNQIVIAAEKLKINRKYIGRALKTGKPYCGFYWKYKK